MSDYADFCRDMKTFRENKKMGFKPCTSADLEEIKKYATELVIRDNGDRLVIVFDTKFGPNTVDLNFLSGEWKKRRGSASGIGVWAMMNYFKPKGWNRS